MGKNSSVTGANAKAGFRQALLTATMCLAGCQTPTMPSMTHVPPEWRDQHPWGPKANALREQGLLQVCPDSPEFAAWREFGKEHIQDGDIILRRGLAVGIKDKITNHILVTATDSAFSHDAIAHWKDGKIWVYDAELEGIRHMPFEVWILDVVPHKLAIYRPRAEFQRCIPQAIAYCHEKYLEEVPFDKDLGLGDDKLYCTELIEKAYRSAGMVISDPVPLRCQPQYHRYAILGPLGERVTGLRRDMPIFSVGNQHHGLLSSPNLELVFIDPQADPKRRHKAPTCAPAPFP